MALEKKTAFLVIHGIGQQKPFETLDQFGRGLIEWLRKQHGDLILSHALQSRTSGNDQWQESFLRIHAAEGDGFIDVREYYWAHLTEHQITPGEIMSWLQYSLSGAQRLCEENEELKKRFQRYEGIYSWQIYKLGWLLRMMRMFGFASHWRLWKMFVGDIASLLTGYIGDIAIYTSTDQKSRSYAIRQNVIRGASETLQLLLGKRKYDQVIVCGHSLGSVIAYDVLNKLNIKANMNPDENLGLERLAGFVSFGSPLDKIAFFFREHVEREQYIRRQIIDQLFSFRAYQLRDKNPYPLIAPLQPKIDHIQWVNYYSKKDPISDALVFCRMAEEDNVHLELDAHWGSAHTVYWQNPAFYEDIAKRFLGGAQSYDAKAAKTSHKSGSTSQAKNTRESGAD